MREIDIDYPILSQKIMRLYELYILLAEEVDSLSERISNMDIFWDGDANTAFMRHIGDDLIWIAAFLIRIRDLITLLYKVMDIYAAGEKEVLNMIEEHLKF